MGIFPCVLSVKKVFYDSYSTFICSTLYTGGNVLDRTLDTGGFAEEDAVIVVQDVLDALDHIHSRGLIHAAVEPSNIFLVKCRKHAWMEAALEINRRTTPAVLRYELTLRKLLLFKDVDDEVLRELATHFHLVKFSAGKFVAKRGNTCNSMYFVYSGSVVAYVDGVEVDEIKPGGFFGEAAFLGVGGSREHVCDFVSNGHR